VEALSPFLFPAILVAAFYLLFIRPARARTRALTQLQESLTPGAEVMTTSGMYATVASVESDAVVLEISPGVTIRFAKAAVARVIPADVPDDDESVAEVESADDATSDLRTESPTDDRPGDQQAR
jgi:preprotein translocase subunit YajC